MEAYFIPYIFAFVLALGLFVFSKTNVGKRFLDGNE
jgi:hypothetical protein